MSRALEDRLVRVAARLDVDVADRLVADVLQRVTADVATVRRQVGPFRRYAMARRYVIASFAAAVSVLTVVFAAPGTRHAVADWFGIGGTRIERVIAPPVGAEFPTSLDLGAPISAEEARQLTGLPVPGSRRLGAPSGIVVTVPPESGQIVVVYPPSLVLPPSPIEGVGALLSVVDATLRTEMYVKIASGGTNVEYVPVATASGDEVPGVWLSGEPHQYIVVDDSGEVLFDTLRLATNTLLWMDDGLAYRLEASVTRDDALAITATVTPDG